MRYSTTPAFDRALRDLPHSRKEQVKKAIGLLVAFFETGDLPHGLGLKSLKRGLWEIRAGLSDRVIFLKRKDVIHFTLIGSHDEVKKFLSPRVLFIFKESVNIGPKSRKRA